MLIIISLCFLNCRDRYSDYNKFNNRIISLNNELGEKYNIKQLVFDTECIYGKEDLTNLVSNMLDLANFKYQFNKDGLDKLTNQYFTKFKVFDDEYEFRTSSLRDYVNLETVMKSLDSIVKNETPKYQFNFSNINDQAAYLIYAKTDSLRLAIDEGYPCSLPNNSFKQKLNWTGGTYSIVTLSKIPNFKKLLKQYHKSLTEIYNLGYDAPIIRIKRIYMGDIFKNNSIDIYIDGGAINTSSNKFSDNQVKCFWDGSGLVLGYTLVKHYHGQVVLFDKTSKIESKIKGEDYLELVLKAFGKRKQQ